MRFGERAQQQVGLLGAAMPTAEQQALAADVGGFGHGASGYIASFPRRVSRGGAGLCIVAAALQCPQWPTRPLRPEILFPLFAPVTSLKGVGPRFGKLFERLTGPAVVDLLWHLPNGLIDRTHKPKIAQARDGEIATIEVTVDRQVRPY